MLQQEGTFPQHHAHATVTPLRCVLSGSVLALLLERNHDVEWAINMLHGTSFQGRWYMAARPAQLRNRMLVVDPRVPLALHQLLHLRVEKRPTDCLEPPSLAAGARLAS